MDKGLSFDDWFVDSERVHWVSKWSGLLSKAGIAIEGADGLGVSGCFKITLHINFLSAK
jgi:hypothetical protein